MQSILRQSQPGFFKVLGGSFLLHFLILSLGLFLFKAEPKRIFFTPVYTVNLVDPAAIKTKKKKVKKAIKKKRAKEVHAKKKARKKVKAKKAAKPAPKKKIKVREAKKAKAATKNELKKKAPKQAKRPKPGTKVVEKKAVVPAAEKVSIDEALDRIKKKVEEKERRAEDILLASRIKEIQEKKRIEELEARKKQKELKEKLEEEKRLEEIRRRLLREAEKEKVKEKKKALREPLASTEERALRRPEKKAPSGEKPVVTANAPERISREVFELKFKEYYNTVGARIRELWIYPGRSGGGEEALVSVKIARNGELVDSWIEKGSGNRLFDNSALKAVKKAAPFPPLPEAFDGDYLEIGFRFREEGVL